MGCKWLLVLLMLGLVLTSGCVQKQETVKLYECPRGQLVDEISKCPTTTTTPQTSRQQPSSGGAPPRAPMPTTITGTTTLDCDPEKCRLRNGVCIEDMCIQTTSTMPETTSSTIPETTTSLTTTTLTTTSRRVTTTVRGSWHNAGSFQGTSGKSTDLVSIDGEKWRFSWNCIEVTTYGPGYGGINIFVYPEGEDASYVGTPVFMGKCGKSETSYVYEGDKNYYFKVQASNLISWSIKAESYH